MGKRKQFTLYLRKYQTTIILLLAIIVFVLSVLRYLQITDMRDYNSDFLYLPTLFRDLTQWGGGLFEWRLTPAPYFFPDMLLYFLLDTFISNWHVAFLLALIGQLILFTFGWVFLGRYFFKEKDQQLTYASLVFVFVALMLTVPAAVDIIRPQHQISVHFGVMLLLPYIFMLVLRLINGRIALQKMRFVWIWFIVLLILLGISDSIAYVQLVLPLFLAIGFLGLIKKTDWWMVGAMGLSLTIVIALTQLLRLWLIQYRPFPPRIWEIDVVGNAIAVFGQVVIQDWQNNNRLVWVVLLVALVTYTLIILMATHFAVIRRELHFAISFLSLFSLVSILFTFTAVLGSGLFEHRAHFRYFYPLTILPVYTLLLIGYYAVRRVQAVRFIPLLIALVLLGQQGNTIKNIGKLSQYQDHYPLLVACVDDEASKRGLQAGASTYWDAKYISMLSKSDIMMVQATPDFSPFIWINNPEWYGRFPPQFVLFDPEDSYPIDVTRLINLYGYPQEIVDCDTRELWVYNRPEDARFQHVLTDNPIAANWCSTEKRDIPAYVWQVPKSAAIPINTALLAEAEEAEVASGYLPYQPAGEYELNVSYEYDGELAGRQSVAYLRVGIWNIDDEPGDITWSQYPLWANDVIAPVTFAVNGKQYVFVKLYFEGNGSLLVNQFQIEKMTRLGKLHGCD